MRRLTVACSERQGCFVALHGSDANAIFAAAGSSRTFCRALRLQRDNGTAESTSPNLYVGWAGDAALEPGKIEVAQPFATCLGLQDGEQVGVSAFTSATVAKQVMVQPGSEDDWEVVELQAAYLERHFLAQIAVLTPGMVFPVWVHGQVAAKLRVDAKDTNRGECFLVGRDSELAIESKARSAGDRPVAIFGGSTAADAKDPSIRLRVLGFSSDIDTPTARVHQEDLERLAGVDLPSGCLVWLHPPDEIPLAGTVGGQNEATGNTAEAPHAQPGQSVLIRVEATTDVPRRHLLLGRCLAENSRIHRFSIVRLARCRQVPVYVPDIELLPLVRCRDFLGNHDDSDAQWVRSLFEKSIKCWGEVCLTDGMVLQLRGGSLDTTWSRNQLDACAVTEHRCDNRASVAPADGSTTDNDNFSDLDIEDIYAQSEPPTPTEEFEDPLYGADGALANANVYHVDEVDLGLDEAPFVPEVRARAFSQDIFAHHGSRPEVVLVRVRLAVGVARREGGGGIHAAASAPPFVRVSSRTLAGGLHVSVGWSGISEDQAPAKDEQEDCQSEEALPRLWNAVPGLRAFPDQPWEDVVDIIEPPGSDDDASTPLDELKLFSEASEALRAHLLAQLARRPESSRSAAPVRKASSPRSLKHRLALDSLQPKQQRIDIGTEADIVARAVCVPETPTFAVPGATAVLGAHGSGKTMLCRRVCAELGAAGVLPLSVACARLGQPGRKFKSVLGWIRSVFRVACWHAPSVVFFDDFGALCPDVEQGAPNLSVAEERSVILAELFVDLMRELRGSGARVAVLASAPGDAVVHRSLWRAEAFEHKIKLRAPHLKERPEILRILCRLKSEKEDLDVDGALFEDGAMDDWGGRVDGFSVSDLARLVESACIEATVAADVPVDRTNQCVTATEHQSTRRRRPRLALKHLERSAEDFVPSSMADKSFLSSDVRLADIGGLEGPKQALMDMLTMPTKYAALVDRAPVKGRRGLMLVGPPGCGKTMLVHAAAAETKGLLRFLTVKGPELLSKYIGASEAGVRAIFERAAAAAPSVIFFDEIESLAPKRGADSTGVTDRVVNQMLCYLDGVEDRGRVYVIGATSRPDLVDGALMRPGRFDKICYCGLPSEAEKLHICEILAAKNGLEADGPSTELKAQLRRLVTKLPRLFTSADINALFSSAKIEAITESVQARSAAGAGAPGKPRLTFAHLCAALVSAKASVSEADERRYAQVFAQYTQSGAAPSGSGCNLPSGSSSARRGSQMRQKVALA